MIQQTITWHTFQDSSPEHDTDILWLDNADVLRVGMCIGNWRFEDNESGVQYEINPMDEWAYLNQ